MYDTDKIDIFDFGAIAYVIEIVYCFDVITDFGKIYFFEINLN